MSLAVFPSRPKFQLGQSIIHSYKADFMKDGVVSVDDYGVIVGINYCDQDSIFVGWSYQLCLWKSIYYYSNRTEVEYDTEAEYGFVNESDNIVLNLSTNTKKVIERLTKKQLQKYKNYCSNTGNNKLFDLINDVLVKDTYWDNLIHLYSDDTEPQ